MNPNDPQMMSEAPVPAGNEQPQTDPMAQIMATIDGLIKAGGASPEDLQNLQMDIQDSMSMDSQEPTESTESTGGMSEMISKAQGGGY